MTESRHLRLFVKANADVTDAVLAQGDGGAKLHEGVRELVAAGYPGYSLEVTAEPSAGVAALRGQLIDGTATMLADRPDIVLLSIADDVRSLPARGATAEETVQGVRQDLVDVVALIKEKVGAHVLVANVSTIDPADSTHNYHGLAEDPLPLRAHRLAHMLVRVSHEEGISIIDVDRLLAEMGAAENVESAMSYSPGACAVIAAEVVRILEDYGFLDERSLVGQVGAKGAAR